MVWKGVPMKKLLFIVNPRAGKTKSRAPLFDAVAQFSRAGYLVRVYITEAGGQARDITARWGGQYDMVVCAGGDGTLNETLSGLMQLEQRPLLGYLPAGSTNDFSKTLRLPANLQKAAAIAAAGDPFACDMGQFNDNHIFVYVAAFGLFTNVAYETPQEIKQILGHAAYVLKGIQSLTDITSYSMTIEHDGVMEEGNFIYGMVSDSISVGGFQGIKKSHVELDDGLFEVMLVRNPQTIEELNTILTALITKQPDGNVIGFQSGDITFECEEAVAWTLDGEYGGDVDKAHIVNNHQAIRIMRG